MERSPSIDTLRVVATLLVVLIHTSADYVTRPLKTGIYDSIFWTGNIIDSLCRVAVPIFVLISGRFLLGRRETFGVFYRKRAVRILIPLVVWTVVYSLYKVLLMFGNFSLKSLFKTGHLWYLYMIVGLYFITPVINLCINNVSRKSLWNTSLFLIGFGVFISAYDFFYENKPFFLLWFVNYLGYFLLGYLLKNSRPISKNFLAATYVITSVLIAIATYYTLKTFKNLYFYEYLSPLVILASLSFYKIFCQVSIQKNLFSIIAHLSFGIYLSHAGILDLLNRLFRSQGIAFWDHSLISIPIKFAVVLSISVVISATIYRVKWLRRIL